MTTAPAPAHWSADALAGIAAQADARLPVFTAQDVVPILPDHDLWDMWQIAYADGELDKYEDSLVLKISDLLYVNRAKVMRLKHDAQLAAN